MTVATLDVSTVERAASILLGVESFASVARECLTRCLIEGGRFEAGRFGANQHSSASAGAVLNGVASLPFIEQRTRTDLSTRGLALLSNDGTLRGHDDEPTDGVTSWSLSQVLLGVARLSNMDLATAPNFVEGLGKLLAYQTPDGDWELRRGDISDASWLFYPMMVLNELLASVDFAHRVEGAARASMPFLAQVFSDGRGGLGDRVLIGAVLQQPHLRKLLPDEFERSVQESQRSLIVELMQPNGFSAIGDRAIQNELQPRWHGVMWSPLFYSCTRRLGPPTQPFNVHLASRLIRSFDKAELCWRAPTHRRGPGSSWPTSLALRNVYKLAHDLCRRGVSAEEYLKILEAGDLAEMFDVVISFGGPDRVIAEAIRNRLVDHGFKVFYDADYQHRLLGEDLAVLLQDIYFAKSRYAIAILSKAFVKSDWAGNWEWRAVLARMGQERTGYVLPYFLEQVKIPGLNRTIGYMTADKFSPEQFADEVAKKLRENRVI